MVKTLLALGAGGIVPPYFSAFAGDSGKIWAAADGVTEPFDIFRDVSLFVTLRDDLDASAMKALYDVFKDEPWAPEHLAGIHKKVNVALKQRPSLKDKSWGFTEGESWFLGHLLTTWYLGIYYHKKITKRLIYSEALMFSSTRGLLPLPFLEPAGFGNWAHPPEGHE